MKPVFSRLDRRTYRVLAAVANSKGQAFALTLAHAEGMKMSHAELVTRLVWLERAGLVSSHMVKTELPPAEGLSRHTLHQWAYALTVAGIPMLQMGPQPSLAQQLGAVITRLWRRLHR